MARRYSSVSVQTTLAVGISNNALSATVSTGTAAALLGGISLAAGNADQFKIIIDPDTLSAEVVYVTGVTSDTLTIVRGRDGTSGIAHISGAIVKHVVTGEDLTYFATGVAPVSNLAAGVAFPGSTSGTATLKAAAVAGTTVQTLPTVTGTLMSAESVDAATSKTTPVDADELPLADSAASFGIKKLTWANLKATLFGGAWTAYTPTITAGSGTFTTVSANGKYKQLGKTLFVELFINITTVGTAAGYIKASLPIAPLDFYSSAKVMETTSTLISGAANISTDGFLYIYKYDGTTLCASTRTLQISATYEVA